MSVLSASLPPLRYRTTRLRRARPCARARSDRNAGAAKLTVKAATPPRTNSRLVIAMGNALHQLVIARSDNQVSETRGLDQQLRIGPGPCTAGTRIVRERLKRFACVRRRREPIEHQRDERIR